MDPGGNFFELGGEKREGLDGEAFAVRGVGHEGVDAPTAARVRVWDSEDVGGGVAGVGIAEEDGTAGGGAGGGEGAVC